MPNTLRLSLLASMLLPAIATAAQSPSPGRWEARALPGGGAIAVIGGPGALQTFSLMCRSGTPVAVAVLANGQPKSQPAQLGLSFGLIRVDLPLSHDASSGNVWFSDLRASPLPKLLSSQSGKVGVSLNGQTQGELSLQGSTKASTAALKGCANR